MQRKGILIEKEYRVLMVFVNNKNSNIKKGTFVKGTVLFITTPPAFFRVSVIYKIISNKINS